MGSKNSLSSVKPKFHLFQVPPFITLFTIPVQYTTSSINLTLLSLLTIRQFRIPHKTKQTGIKPGKQEETVVNTYQPTQCLINPESLKSAKSLR